MVNIVNRLCPLS